MQGSIKSIMPKKSEFDEGATKCQHIYVSHILTMLIYRHHIEVQSINSSVEKTFAIMKLEQKSS